MNDNGSEITPQPLPTTSESNGAIFASALTSSSPNVVVTENQEASITPTPESKSSRDEVIQAVNISFESFAAFPEDMLTKEQVAESE